MFIDGNEDVFADCIFIVCMNQLCSVGIVSFFEPIELKTEFYEI